MKPTAPPDPSDLLHRAEAPDLPRNLVQIWVACAFCLEGLALIFPNVHALAERQQEVLLHGWSLARTGLLALSLALVFASATLVATPLLVRPARPPSRARRLLLDAAALLCPVGTFLVLG